MFRPRKTELSERGIWEPVEREEDVLGRIQSLLQFSGVRTIRVRERVPFTLCPFCNKRIKVRGKLGEAGIPDLFGYVPPATWAKHHPADPGPFHAVPFFIEVKRPVGGEKRWSQIAFIEHAQRDGVLAFFANSWDVVRVEFKKLGIELPEYK